MQQIWKALFFRTPLENIFSVYVYRGSKLRFRRWMISKRWLFFEFFIIRWNDQYPQEVKLLTVVDSTRSLLAAWNALMWAELACSARASALSKCSMKAKRVLVSSPFSWKRYSFGIYFILERCVFLISDTYSSNHRKNRSIIRKRFAISPRVLGN